MKENKTAPQDDSAQAIDDLDLELTMALEKAGAQHMPPLRHCSEVAEWICSLPEVRQAVFDTAERSLIAYDPATGLWSGTGRPAC
jgi:hypothetical protein